MGRRLDSDGLVDTTEIARRLGVSDPSVVHNWVRRHPKFPEPVARFPRAVVWYWPDVEKWATKTGRLRDQ